MEDKVKPLKFTCAVGGTLIKCTAQVSNETGIRDYSVVASIDQAIYTFRMTMCGLGTVPMYVVSGFKVDDDRFVHTITPNPMRADALFDLILNRIVSFHDAQRI